METCLATHGRTAYQTVGTGLEVRGVSVVTYHGQRPAGFEAETRESPDPSVKSAVQITLGERETGEYTVCIDLHDPAAPVSKSLTSVSFILYRFTLVKGILNLASALLLKQKEAIFVLPAFYKGMQTDVREMCFFFRSFADYKDHGLGSLPVVQPLGGDGDQTQYIVSYKTRAGLRFYILALPDPKHPQFFRLFAANPARVPLSRLKKAAVALKKWSRKHKLSEEDRCLSREAYNAEREAYNAERDEARRTEEEHTERTEEEERAAAAPADEVAAAPIIGSIPCTGGHVEAPKAPVEVQFQAQAMAERPRKEERLALTNANLSEKRSLEHGGAERKLEQAKKAKPIRENEEIVG
jgi:hypothetical protein